MKRIFSLLFLLGTALIALPGCGGSGTDSSNVAEDADQAAIDEYKAAIEAEQKEAQQTMGEGQ